jgi:integral membrane protein (TIGR01906 family)
MILLGFAIIIESALYVINNDSLIIKEQIKSKVFERLEKDDILEVDEEVLGYMRGERPFISTGLLNEKEKVHMGDVRRIVRAMKITRTVFFLITIFLILFSVYTTKKARIMDFFSRMLRDTAIFTLALVILLSIASFLFENSFDLFHNILFTNDLWKMDPATDTLNLYYPQSFFLNLFIYIILRCTIIAVIFYLLHMLLDSKILKRYLFNKKAG